MAVIVIWWPLRSPSDGATAGAGIVRRACGLHLRTAHVIRLDWSHRLFSPFSGEAVMLAVVATERIVVSAEGVA